MLVQAIHHVGQPCKWLHKAGLFGGLEASFGVNQEGSGLFCKLQMSYTAINKGNLLSGILLSLTQCIGHGHISGFSNCLLGLCISFILELCVIPNLGLSVILTLMTLDF